MNAINQDSTMAAVMRKLAERKAWENANPELAADWAEANRIDDEKRIRTERDDDAGNARKLALDVLRRAEFPPIHLVRLDMVNIGREHLQKSRLYLHDTRPVLAMLGKVGQGKTFAACWAARELLARLPLDAIATGQSTTPAEFLRATTFARLSAYAIEDKALFDRLCRVRVLVLDDLGTETLAGVAAAYLDELIDIRIAHSRRTIITSNLDSHTFKARYGERLSDRLRQSAVISLGSGASLRHAPGQKSPEGSFSREITQPIPIPKPSEPTR